MTTGILLRRILVACAAIAMHHGAWAATPVEASRPAIYPRVGFADGLVNLQGWAFSSDTRHLLTSDDAALRVWDTASWREVRTLHGHQLFHDF